MEEKKDDVTVAPSATPNPDEVVEPKKDGDDKSKNFAELRKKNQELERQLAEERKLREEGEQRRSLHIVKEDEEKDEPKTSEHQETPFERDMRKAVKSWNEKNKITAEEWAGIKKHVALKGDELDSEIEEKIDAAYHALPGTREKREKEIAVKAKKEAMRDFQDEELDMGGGGEVDLGGGTEPRFTGKEKKWLDAFGVKAEARKAIAKSSEDYRDWKVLDPERK